MILPRISASGMSGGTSLMIPSQERHEFGMKATSFLRVRSGSSTSAFAY